MSRRARGLLLVSIGLLGVASDGAAAPRAEIADIRFRYEDAPLVEIVRDVAHATGERFVFDPDMPGRFTVIIPRKVTRSEAFALLEATLLMQGYVLARGPVASHWQVVKVHVASSSAPWGGPVLDADRSSLITTMIRLERADAEEVADHITDVVGPQDSIVAFSESNSLILTGSEKRLRRMIQLIRALDVAGLPVLRIRTLRYRDANEVSKLLEEAMASPEDSIEEKASEPMLIRLDARTNSLILQGSANEITRARAFIDGLDVPLDVGTKIRVIRIYHRDAKEVARRLLEMAIGRVLVGSQQGAGEDVLGPPYAVVADLATNSIVVDADPQTMVDLLDMVAELDRPQPRIQVDVIAYEVTNPVDRSLAIGWFLPAIEPGGFGQTNLILSSNPSGNVLQETIGPDISFFGRAGRKPLVLPFVDDTGSVSEVILPRESAVIGANERSVQTRVLLKPRLMMVSGQEQELFVGQNVPIPVAKDAKASSNQTSTQIERHDVGIHLRITPKLGEAGKVELDLKLELSRVGESVAGSLEVVGPTLESRAVESKILLADGELAVIGLSQERSRTGGDTGTPFLKDIPVFGTLFRASGSSAVDAHLVFAVQVRILRTHDEDLAESIRQRLALERSQSRVSGLERSPGKPYAILLATRSGEDDAGAIAESFEREGLEVQVGRWQLGGEDRFDVYLTGYTEFAPAGGDALQLRERGWAPQVVVLPGETALATMPPLRLLGSQPGAASRTDREAP